MTEMILDARSVGEASPGSGASPMAINLLYYPDRCIFPEYIVLALSILCQRAYAKEFEGDKYLSGYPYAQKLVSTCVCLLWGRIWLYLSD